MCLHQNDISLSNRKKTDYVPDETQKNIKPDKGGRVSGRGGRKKNVEKEVDLSETLKEVEGFLKSEIDREDKKKVNVKTILYLQEDQMISSGRKNLSEILMEDEFLALKKLIKEMVSEELDSRERSNKN